MNFKKFLGSFSLLSLSSMLFADETEKVAESVADTAEKQFELMAATGTKDPQSAAEAVADIATKTTNEFKSMLHLDELTAYLTWGNLARVITSLIAILIFFIIYKVIQNVIKNKASQRMQPHTVGLLKKAVSYVFYIIMAVYILGLFGIKLSAVWGAAGVAGLAIGFAAQTSVSNVISGIFVLTEKAMKIGDFIEVDGVSGTVDSISLLSVKIRTLDNQVIRIPNSTVINTKLENYSLFDMRRYVFNVSIDYGSNLDAAMAALKTVPARCPTVITNDENFAPSYAFTTLGDSGINMCICVWCNRADFWQTKSDVCENVVKAFNENGINIPFNRVDVTLLNEKTVPAANIKA